VGTDPRALRHPGPDLLGICGAVRLYQKGQLLAFGGGDAHGRGTSRPHASNAVERLLEMLERLEAVPIGDLEPTTQYRMF